MKTFRALWLMNHRTLRKFEVNLLLDYGMEVFCPKSFPYDEGNLSADIDFSFDSTLSIPEESLSVLNEVNFYEPVSDDILSIINRDFDIVFVGFFPNQLKYLVEGFGGIIVMQAFGLANGVTYTDVITDTLGISFLHKIELLGDRFVFAPSYENISEIECDILRTRAVYLPLGLSNATEINDWQGGDERILFVCPRINTSEYFRRIYDSFVRDFEGFDYVIGGEQPIDVLTDNHVKGFIDQDEYDYNMTHLSAMFYHSQEKRHLHYHPIEAVRHGMPLVYMSGGLLDQLAGRRLAGSCNSAREARNKINRIIRGDQHLIKRIQKDQRCFLEPFSYKYCKEKWDPWITQTIQKMEAHSNSTHPVARKKIAVLLPEGYLGGVLDFTYRFVLSIKRGIQELGDEIDLIFGYIQHENFSDRDLWKVFADKGIQIREFTWKIVDENYINNTIRLSGLYKRYPEGNYCLADDGGYFFEDCDYIIVVVDRVPCDFFTMKPYGVVVHDYIQRYMPEQYGSFYERSVINLQRFAEGIFVMTTPAAKDAIQYAGLPSDKVHLIPLMLERSSVCTNNTPDEIGISSPYFLWSTNLGQHKNHIRALKALIKYYENGGTLKCVITGSGTNSLISSHDTDNDYIKSVREMIYNNAFLKQNIVVMGNLIKDQYLSLLKNACFFFHPAFIDNGNMTCFDAACLGVPTISSRYPAMEYYEECMKLGILFFNPFDVDNISLSLLCAEESYETYRLALPTPDQLDKYTISQTYIKTYQSIKRMFSL